MSTPKIYDRDFDDMKTIVENSNIAPFTPVAASIPKIYVIHENEEWVEPLWKELDLLGIPYENWCIHDGGFNLGDGPPEGVFYNKMSASSHTRGHRFSVELTNPLITWLEAHGRKVINGGNTVQTEVNKAAQSILLQAAGIRVPETYIANNTSQVLAFARKFNGLPFIVKPNRGGKGLGVQLFHGIPALQSQLENDPSFESLDGIYLIQQYIKPPNNEIVRMEFIGGKFYYAVAVDTSGGFELCPADACVIDDQFCPTTPGVLEKPKFKIIEDFDNEDIAKLEAFMKKHHMDIAGMEFVENEKGERFVYDINTNTNYNSDAEAVTDFKYKGMRQVAAYLALEFDAHYNRTN